MAEEKAFYICPVCFHIEKSAGSHHGRKMIFCKDLQSGDEMCKPEFFQDGNLKSRAPKWFLQSVREAAGMDILDFDDHNI